MKNQEIEFIKESFLKDLVIVDESKFMKHYITIQK